MVLGLVKALASMALYSLFLMI